MAGRVGPVLELFPKHDSSEGQSGEHVTIPRIEPTLPFPAGFMMKTRTALYNELGPTITVSQ